MSDKKTSQPDPRTKQIEENGVTFPCLFLSGNFEVEEECKRTLMRAEVEKGEACGLSGATLYGAISERLPARVTMQDVYDFLWSAQGQRYVFAKSLVLAGIADEGEVYEAVKHYRGFDGFNLAMALCGYMARLTPAEIQVEKLRIAKLAADLKEPKPKPPADRDPDEDEADEHEEVETSASPMPDGAAPSSTGPKPLAE